MESRLKFSSSRYMYFMIVLKPQIKKCYFDAKNIFAFKKRQMQFDV